MIKTETSVFVERAKIAVRRIEEYLELLDELNDGEVAEDILDTTMEILNEIESAGTEVRELSCRLWMKWHKAEEKHEII